MKKILFGIPLFSLIAILFSDFVSAHCPLCTLGAGAAAGAAVWLGVSKVVVALFLGAFSMAIGLWFSKFIKKKYIPYQKSLIALIVFLATLIPLLPFFTAIGPLYIPFMGDYGLTYAFNYSIASSLLGAGIILASPFVSRKATIISGKTFPYQAITITLLMLIISGGIIQLIV
ncbi:hypothetical protein COU59_03390 [Candidatus Pacearchaeota archaeon CG10_big_fil_rev_8_21_14_0_10_34_12]|nr:MAG: hypothetical protein COU59_03390 [Candidatus Pacearchaeota archaeon CG10_big_fil_rev_8_21_14_0_10_34_12]